jgi:hypothetical protein
MITGGVKYFDLNVAWLSNGGSIVDTLGTGTSVVNNLLGKSRYAYWSTVGSNDSTVETLTLTFPSYAMSRIFVVGHNWKQFTAKYWNGAAFVDFTSVVGLDGSLVGGISETAFADSTAYYEVAPVTTTQVRFTITKTQVANAEKTAVFIVVTSELGTLQGFPQISPAKVSRNLRTLDMPSGKKKVIKAPESYDMILDFSPYAASSTYAADLDLMYTLHTRDTAFLMWPCGGRRGSTYFKYTLRELRLQDLFCAQLVTDISAAYFTEGIYTGAVDLGQLEFAEHV